MSIKETIVLILVAGLVVTGLNAVSDRIEHRGAEVVLEEPADAHYELFVDEFQRKIEMVVGEQIMQEKEVTALVHYVTDLEVRVVKNKKYISELEARIIALEE